MPELPEVQTIVNGLNEKIKGAIIADVLCDWKKMIIEPDSWGKFRKEILNKKIQKVERKGKFIIFVLDKGRLIVHLRMTGHFLVINKEKKEDKQNPIHEKVNQYIHFILKLKDGREVALSDLRKFAKVYFSDLSCRGVLQSALSHIGADPTEKEFTFEKFLDILKKKKGNIKQILMDQSLISGIGNIYSSEILWEAKISPLSKKENLNEKELKQIYNAIAKVLKKAIEKRGSSESDYRDVNGKEGGYQKIQKVYQRDGEACHRRDGGIIKRVKIGQRSGFYCDKCQKLL